MDGFTLDSDDLIIYCTHFDSIPVEELTDSALDVALEDLNCRWTNVRQSYRSCMLNRDSKTASPGLAEPDELESVRGKFATCTNTYHKCKVKILDLQKSIVTPTDKHPTVDSFKDQMFGGPSHNGMQVPPCDSQIFYGGYEEWPSFRDMFSAIYGTNSRLSSVQKLYYLRLKVKGQAAAIVNNYKLCGENFNLAWQALKTRYENKRILVDNQLKVLFNMQPILLESSESLQEIQMTINDCLAALKAQNISVGEWDPILIYLCSTKLPLETLSLWEQSLRSHKDLPKWDEMNAFLSNRYEVVERLNSILGTKPSSCGKQNADVSTFVTESTQQFTCKLCQQQHGLKLCSVFKAMDPSVRNLFVSKNTICVNCLSYTHLRKDCKSKFLCQDCKKNHNTLLHIPKESTKVVPTKVSSPALATNFSSLNSEIEEFTQTTAHFTVERDKSPDENTLLPTALVDILHNGDTFTARAFMDQGSERTFISKRLQQRLMLSTEPKHFQIRGMGGNLVGNSSQLCHLMLISEKHDMRIPIQAIVVPKITRLLPNFFVPASRYSIDQMEHLDLADPEFHSPGPVDLLIGSNVIPRLLLNGVRKICDSLIAQSTVFGWIISGPINSPMTISSFSLETTEIKQDLIAQQLKAFWNQEEIPDEKIMSKDDEYCESLYASTTKRDSSGRYIVKLPFKSGFPHELPLGPSRSTAWVQYIKMELSMHNKPDMWTTYNDVLGEYLSLGHMEETAERETISRGSCHSFYLPHHAVTKPDSRTTKVRVVFNASRKTNSGHSLNDVLHVGPTLQSDLMLLVLNWRLYRYVFSGDIEKMYRQIRIHKDDIPFQRIVFRPNPTSPIRDFSLKTVTFGVKCAPYLAIRTLFQLADDYKDQFPQASQILRRETYVDDILSGAHDVCAAQDSLSQIISLLDQAGFPLRKITANCSQVLASVQKDHILDSEFLKFHETSDTKMLGIQWNALSDCFSYRIIPIETSLQITKRKILSTISRLFDPAGWLTPIIIQTKILLQNLWLEGTNWDKNVGPSTLQRWNQFVENFPQIALIRIPRWVNFAPSCETQIHGFCDASEKAYCAAVYLRIRTSCDISTHLLVAKSKVAPLDPISLPRLELCGAVLLAKLVRQLLKGLPLHNFEMYLWCDSSIVLGWLGKPPCTWKTFIANRTAKIIRSVGNCTWRHIRSADNPADLGSRGCSPQDLLQNILWWHGPSWLRLEPESWPKSLNISSDLPEMRKIEVFCAHDDAPDILDNYSKWDKAVRVTAYILRFYFVSSKKRNPYESRTITHAEFNYAKNRLIILAQRRYYPKEYVSILKDGVVSTKSPLYSLNPFLDRHNVLRVDGRIANSDLPFNTRYPIILPALSRFCILFVDFLHDFLLHAEYNLMVRTIRDGYYVSRLKSVVKKCVRQCKICIVYKQRAQTQLMAALPADRCTFSLPFTITGLDFAGPFQIKTSLLRQAPFHKGYVCLFICFSTKAVHLELCSDLTSGAFQAAFTRFVSRRGLPKKVLSDNGTNFVGAERAIRYELTQFLGIVPNDIAAKYASHGLEWSFIPPNAPHMGGLWEAGVKSFKMHLKKVAQNHKFTFEEFTTLLTRIEAVLNSRPLSPMSDDPHELLALTPGHFLRGAPLVSTPEVPPDPISNLDRWGKLKALQHNFARRWKDEYIKELHKRYKWQRKQDNVSIGQLVVVKDDLLPPSDWRLGRITKVYNGADNRVRVADIRTQTGTITRPIVKLCILPITCATNET